ncbi:hypothetical protein [Actinomadura rudentiformis]|uniref:hypothetical protein n=1 Tax=Actinomadura rudentiformis TaxID=359158 RepID=UPI00178C32E4|nr:hypothetical protein [Actinomadura rudentiformis]
MDAVPRWANVAARLVPLTVLPFGLWLIAMGLGVPLGFSGELADGPSWRLTPSVLTFSLLIGFFAFLALGLVRPWGEVFPRWIPFAGGRNVPTLFAASVASLGAVAVTFVGFAGALGWYDTRDEAGAPQGVAAWVMVLCYAPFLAWGPLLAIVTVHYLLRRTRGTHSISESRAGSKPTGNGASVENDSPALTLRTMR